VSCLSIRHVIGFFCFSKPFISSLLSRSSLLSIRLLFSNQYKGEATKAFAPQQIFRRGFNYDSSPIFASSGDNNSDCSSTIIVHIWLKSE
jgi:hypothetical protein